MIQIKMIKIGKLQKEIIDIDSIKIIICTYIRLTLYCSSHR